MGGGCAIVQNRSLSQLITSTFTEYKWDINAFDTSDIWTDEKTANYFVQWLKKQPESEVACLHRCVKLLRIKDSSALTRDLKTAFPKYNWFSVSPARAKKTQFMLKECINTLFFNKETVLLEEYKHPDLNYLELDFFYPEFNLAFEYQVCIKITTKCENIREFNILLQ